MNEEQTRQFNEMIRKVDELYRWMEDRKRQQLTFPLDLTSVNVLNEAFRTKYFDVVKTRELFLKPGLSVSPSVEGQIVYNENGGTQQIQAFVDGAVKVL